ncbi:MAG: membrane protein insertion efficiency factor YidD [Lentisphaeraceae bacterium]|nr:membrane protein insertion efficiency factor YidD [Lentisphaeraceae bacterium]
MFPPSCRFHPTCSHYAAEALRRHGFFRGIWLSFVRIIKCQPFYKGNLNDPVPPVNNGD